MGREKKQLKLESLNDVRMGVLYRYVKGNGWEGLFVWVKIKDP